MTDDPTAPPGDGAAGGWDEDPPINVRRAVTGDPSRDAGVAASWNGDPVDDPSRAPADDVSDAPAGAWGRGRGGDEPAATEAEPGAAEAGVTEPAVAEVEGGPAESGVTEPVAAEVEAGAGEPEVTEPAVVEVESGAAEPGITEPAAAGAEGGAVEPEVTERAVVEVEGGAVEPGVTEPAGAGGGGEPGSRLREAARRAIEALVLVTEQPLGTHLLGQLLEMSPVVIDDLCRELAAEYEEQGRGFQLVEVAGGWRYQSHPDLAPYVERFVLEGQTSKLSAAALETLAIVAYKQPISRAQVASIRGVSVEGVMRTLQQRGYIAEIGKDPGPGQAVLFGTTPLFLEKLGLNDVDELPPLGDFVPGADVVEQLERSLRPDREPLRPEDAMSDGEGHDPLAWLSEVEDGAGIDPDGDDADFGEDVTDPRPHGDGMDLGPDARPDRREDGVNGAAMPYLDGLSGEVEGDGVDGAAMPGLDGLSGEVEGDGVDGPAMPDLGGVPGEIEGDGVDESAESGRGLFEPGRWGRPSDDGPDDGVGA